MKIIRIDKNDWAGGLKKSRAAYLLVGPIKDEGQNTARFRQLGDGELPDLERTDTVLSPKSVVYPQSEVLFQYSLDVNSPDCNLLKRPDRKYAPRAVVGIRPYDAAAFLVLKNNFDTPEYRDPYWCDAYQACTFIGLAINTPLATDFSTSTGCGPFSEKGLDVLLVDADDHFLAKVLTEKGAAFLNQAGWESETDTEKALETIETLKSAAESGIESKISFDAIADASISDLYQAEFWEDVAFSCINCGTCTYLCPTCWCFDVQDESRGKSGTRCKNWDSCMYPLFTLHGSGHNPRGDKLMRVRQRFMHKLKYYLDKYEDGIMCVGCGRCVRACPVNIDIRQVADLMNSTAGDKSACVVE